MEKQLKKLVGKSITLTEIVNKKGVGDVVYTGYLSSYKEEKSSKTINHYLFRANNGRSFDLCSGEKNKVTVEDGGLVLKI